MKANILIVSIFLLLAVLMVMPVMAEAPTKVPVTATTTAGAGTFSGLRLNDGGIFSYDGAGTGTVVLFVDGASVPLTFISSSTFNGTIDTKTNDGVIHHDLTWTAKDSSGNIVGTFEGQVNGYTVTTGYLANGYPNPFMSTNTLHCVLQGTGLFHGQTLKLDGVRPTAVPPKIFVSNPVTWVGTLLSR